MNPYTALAIGIVIGIVIQAWRTAGALKCSILPVIKSGGGPGEPDDP